MSSHLREKVRWGDSQTITFEIPAIAGVPLDVTQNVQLLDARIDRPTTWQLLAQAILLARDPTDVVTAFLDIDVAVGSARVPLQLAFPFFGVAPSTVNLNTLGGFGFASSALMPVLLPAEALYVSPRVRVTNAGPVAAHRVVVRISVVMAPIFAEVYSR